MADVLTEASASEKKSKAEIEQLIKANGGKFYQTNTAAPHTVCVADRSMFLDLPRCAILTIIGTVKVASLQKSGEMDIIRPSWLTDCVKQNVVDAGLPDMLLPQEPRYKQTLKTLVSVLTRKQAYVLYYRVQTRGD